METQWLPILTLILWIGCIATGVLGWALPYESIRATEAKATPLPIKDLHVTLEPVPARAIPVVSPPLPTFPVIPSLPRLQEPAKQPAKIPLESSIPALPIPPRNTDLPVSSDGLSDTAVAVVSPTAASPTQAADVPNVKELTLGKGEGLQPAPEYPWLAKRERQEGTVRARLSVNSLGRVTSVEAVVPSRWPMLNQAVLKVIRDKWVFTEGQERQYEVSITFKLTK